MYQETKNLLALTSINTTERKGVEMKRLFLLVSILLLVGGAGRAMAEENPPEEPKQELPAVGLDIQAEVGDLVAIGPLVPGKLREVCAIVGFTPKVKPEMTGVFCYPSGKKGTPARNGYINIYLAWGKLIAPGGGRWTGANKIGPWTNGGWEAVADPHGRGWTTWMPQEEWDLWQKKGFPLSQWPQPVFTKAQLKGQITKTIYGDPADDPSARPVSSEIWFTMGFITGMKLGGFDGYGRPDRTINCWLRDGKFALVVDGQKRQEAWCGGDLSRAPPYPYLIQFWEPWGPKEVRPVRNKPS